jgi:ribonucleoside-diphosphate reductase alpha chain
MMVQNSISPHFVSLDKNEEDFKDGLFVGWMLGDGWVSDAYKDKKPNRVSFGFIVGNEEKIAKEFIKDKINSIKAERELPVGWLNSSGGAKSFELTSSSLEVQKYFEKYGYKSSIDNKTIPNEILKQSHSFKRGFIAGLFSADGYCDTYRSEKNYRIGFSSCEEDIVKKIQIMLNEFGICSTMGSAIVHCNLNDKWYNHFNLTIGTARDCSKFMNEIGFHLSEKKEKSGWNFPKNNWRKKLTGEYKIKSIEYVGEEDTYDINTDITHSLIANGILISNCGETTLGPYGVCDLGSLVLPNFITGNINTNWKKLEATIKLAVRFLDNVIEVNKYALKDIDINAHKSRRIGIGVIGLAEYLFAKKVRYGTQRAVDETERLMQFIRNICYQTSMELAIEKGAFPQFDPIAYGKASFVRKLPATLRMDIKKYGIRNCTTMALAPTGTISLIADYTSAIEPLFAKAMMRKDRVGTRMYIHPKYESMIRDGEEIPDWFVDSFDLDPKDHFEMQVACQKFCDASVSKTINLPTKTTDEDLSSLLLEYIHDLKGVTVYRDGSREGQILNRVTEEEVRDYIANDIDADNNLNEDQVKCATGSCEI